MSQATLTTAWTGTGTAAAPYRAKVADSYALTSWVDTGYHSPQAGPFPVQITCTPAVLASIQADPTYSSSLSTTTTS